MTPGAVRFDPSNTAQVEIWDGDEGAYWAANAQRFDRTVAPYHEAFLEAAAIRPTDRVLDIGCGSGQTTRDAARRATAGSVLGVDVAARMLQVARRLAADEGVANVTFLQADAQIHDFGNAAFDIAISRTGAMFFGDPPAAFGNIATALRERGRLVLLNWRGVDKNEWFVDFLTALAAGRPLRRPPPDTPGPFALSDPERTSAILAGAGFRDVQHTPLDGDTWYGADIDDAHAFIVGFLRWLVDGIDDATRARAHANLDAVLAPHATERGVIYPSATWLVTATRG